jgi:hypothetical protein
MRDQPRAATAAAALDWLPADLRNRILGASNANVEVTFDTERAGKTVEVLVELPDYAAKPILPRSPLAVQARFRRFRPASRAEPSSCSERTTARGIQHAESDGAKPGDRDDRGRGRLGFFALRLVKDLRHTGKAEVVDARVELTKVVVAIAPIEEGKPVKADSLSLEEVSLVPDGSFQKVDDVVGARSTSPSPRASAALAALPAARTGREPDQARRARDRR